MRAVVVDRFMEPSELRVSQVPEPVPGPGQVLVAVRAAALNFSDILMVQGRYQVKPPFPFTPGSELAGEVLSVGDGVRALAPGDRVLASGRVGAFAERVALDAARCIRVPGGLDFAEAACLPIVYGTSYAALVQRARLERTETLLVHAAAGGVGLAAVQIGRALGARVLATAGGSAKCAIALEHGAELAIDYRSDDFVARVNEATDGRGADVVYDPVGGDTFDRSLRAIAWNGRLLVVGFASGTIPEVKVNRVMLKNVAIVGVHWSAYEERDPEAMRAVYAGLFDLVARGAVRPVISARHALEELPAALEALGARQTVGKLVVEP